MSSAARSLQTWMVWTTSTVLAVTGVECTRHKHAELPDASDAALVDHAAMPERKDLCARSVSVIEPLAGTKPFERADGLCDNGSGAPQACMMVDHYDFPPTPADTCFVAKSNIDNASAKARVSTARSGPSAAVAWDGKHPPKYAARVEAHLAITDAERALLAQNGFVVLSRKPVHSYVAAYHDIFQEQLPLYVTADSILHAIFRSEDALLEGLERSDLRIRAVELVTRLRTALRSMPRSEAAEDVDVYLTVAAQIIESDSDKGPTSTFGGANALASDIIAKMNAADSVQNITIYGRTRTIDFSKYAPTSHYTDSHDADATLSLAQYFKLLTWLSRHEWNLVTRGCQSSTPVEAECSTQETPREARAALALAELVDRANVRPILARFESVYATFGGVRDDVPVAALSALVRATKRTPEGLAKAIGEGYKRFAVTHPMPTFDGDHEGRLPAIATLIGARIPPDLDPVGSVMRSAYPAPLSADVFAALLGHDPSLRQVPASPAHLVARELAPPLKANARKGRSLYDAWMSAVLALGDSTSGSVPSFWKTPAHANLRMNSALVGYGQIRHNFVLMSASAYDAYGCDIPDAYVEPHLPVYEALLKYAERGKSMAGRDAATVAYFERTIKVLQTLIAITKHELEGRALTTDEIRYLAMVTEYTPQGGYGGDSVGPPKRTGWYYGLFTDQGNLAEKGSDFVGEVATNALFRYVFMLGAEAARLGLFVVDKGGEPRLMVGPVATGYEARAPLSEPRWTDETAWNSVHSSDWASTYTAPLPVEPSVDGSVVSCDDGTKRVFLRATANIDASTVVLTDHHGDPATPQTPIALSPNGTLIAFRERTRLPPPPEEGTSVLGVAVAPPGPKLFRGLRLHVAEHREGTSTIPAFDVILGPSVYHTNTGGEPPHLAPAQAYRGFGNFALGSLREKP
jgi:hypothetical protein